MRILLLVSILTTLVAGVQDARYDWPQFFGPGRDGVYRGDPILAEWGPDGPAELWRRDVGAGFSGPVAGSGRLILFHRILNREIVEAFDARTGETLWQYAYPTRYRDDFGFDEGPRAVPVIADGAVYTFGAEGRLSSVDFETGRPIWSVDTMERFNVPKGFFGQGGSPLVEDGRVIANIGGPGAGIVAFDARTGEVLWRATDHEASYSSPIGATLSGRRHAIFLTRNGLVGLDPATGEVRFERVWRSRSASSVNAASPRVVGEQIFVSAEYGPGAGVLEWDQDRFVEVWTSNDVLTNHYATSVYHDGYLYGYHGRQELGPSLRAVEFATGRVAWTIEQFRAGSILRAGDRLVILREGGELVLAEASPEAFRPTARAQILPPTTRAYPALAGGLLYIKNDNTLICLDLRL
jgi:outer membrane protein assembly factor BamB